MKPVPLFALLLLAAPAHAEGARQVFDCTITQRCGDTGACAPGSDDVTFTLLPEETEADGGGMYRIEWAGEIAEMWADSSFGPFLWADGDDRHTLLISSETSLLWHILDTARADASVAFMTCAVTQ
ncbi:hypothetical protein [Pseudoroseicyclus tamaricis]|uniref:Uncharacterized protein n=1 Tax=Pseudoroseicyclus tamaricis TaxID=2705421 RepID=A0A6B2JS18_9RHOB|nr:hypothetical protein [Pseudoroseicyclus tamaricis]NDV00775.1 hypothetical protein [Pseudoroseicyclus tamaricis]